MEWRVKEIAEYTPPSIEQLDVETERGFAESLLQYEETPSMDYGDSAEQWF